MSSIPVNDAVEAFLALERIAVTGASRSKAAIGNHIAKKLRAEGYEVFLVNPHAETIDDAPCFASIDAIEGGVQGVFVATAADQAVVVAEQAARAGAEWIWFHQGFGPVSYSDEGIRTAKEAGLKVIAVGCPMMYLKPDLGHACFKTIFRWTGRIPKAIEV